MQELNRVQRVRGCNVKQFRVSFAIKSQYEKINQEGELDTEEWSVQTTRFWMKLTFLVR